MTGPIGLAGLLGEAAQLMTDNLLVDRVDLYDVGDTVTTGVETHRPLTLVAAGLPALVQTSSLPNANGGIVPGVYSAKLPVGTQVYAGQAVKVTACQQEPDLIGTTLLLDSVSQNGLSVIRKCVAIDPKIVNQQGKQAL